MNTDQGLYRRNESVVWRDTGLSAVALVLEPKADLPVVLGGGSAVLWRLLSSPRRLEEILDELSATAQLPPQHDVLDALADLRDVGLITRVDEGA